MMGDWLVNYIIWSTSSDVFSEVFISSFPSVCSVCGGRNLEMFGLIPASGSCRG